MRKALIALGALAVATAALAQQPQIKVPRASQKSSLMQTVGTTDVTITYSRPGVKGRKIWGALVPYDKVWRTGANEATTITFSDDVTVNGQKLAKGTYALATIPTANEWTIAFNKTADQWGAFNYDEKNDALRVKAKPVAAPFAEWLTFEIPSISADEATIQIHWENLAVPFTVNTDSVNKTMAALRAAAAAAPADDWRAPFQAASFAFDSKIAADDMNKWLAQSLKAKETANNLWLKARIQAASGDKATAIKTAEAAAAKAELPAQKDFADEIKRLSSLWK